MLMHGLDYSGIYNANALKAEKPDISKRIGPGSVDVVLANPPFAGLEKDEDILEKFELARGRFGATAAVTREVLFLELIVKLLKEGGRAGIVVPQGVLSNSNLAHVRDYLRKNAEILAVVELPDWAFIPSGTCVRGSLLFIRKASQARSGYGVYMTKTRHIGYTSTGRVDKRNEFSSVLEEYRNQAKSKTVPIANLQSRFDAKFHINQNRGLLALFEKNPTYKLLPLRAIGSFNAERYSPRSQPGMKISVVEIGDVDVTEHKIKPRLIEGVECGYSSLKRAKPGDIVISRRRAYRGAIARVAEDVGDIYVIPEFSVLRLHDGIDPDYVICVLRSPQFTELMTVYSTGEMSSRISERDLQELKLPVPENHIEIGRFLRRTQGEIEKHRLAIDALKRKTAETVAQILEGKEPNLERFG
jgi:type I restriction enzyme M protein